MELREIRVGMRVKLVRPDNHPDKRRGTWPRYEGRLGTVATVNRLDKEVGLEVDGEGGKIQWFYPSDVVLVGTQVIEVGSDGRR